VERGDKKEAGPFSKWFGPGTGVYFQASPEADVWLVRRRYELKAFGGIKKGRGVSPWIVQKIRGKDAKILYRDKETKCLIPGQEIFLSNIQAGRELSQGRLTKHGMVVHQRELQGF